MRTKAGVLYAITDHGGRMEPEFGTDGIDFVQGDAVCEHTIQVKGGADGLGRGRAVAGDHDDAGDASFAQHTESVRSFWFQHRSAMSGGRRIM